MKAPSADHDGKHRVVRYLYVWFTFAVAILPMRGSLAQGLEDVAPLYTLSNEQELEILQILT